MKVDYLLTPLLGKVPMQVLACDTQVQELSPVAPPAYPDPTTGVLHLPHVAQIAPCRDVTIYCSAGTTVGQQEVCDKQLDLSSLQNGVYYLVVSGSAVPIKVVEY